MTNVLLDTNILIYALDDNSIFHQKASEILQRDDLNLFVATKNISEYFAVCSKLGIDRPKVYGFYEDLQLNVSFLFPSEESLLHFETLIKKYEPKGNRVFDLEIVSVMLANNLVKIATFNIGDFKDVDEVEIFSI
ncbi:MAG: type II toxin-antitoxin system VapC family toxin [Bacteroidota bacterium]